MRSNEQNPNERDAKKVKEYFKQLTKTKEECQRSGQEYTHMETTSEFKVLAKLSPDVIKALRNLNIEDKKESVNNQKVLMQWKQDIGQKKIAPDDTDADGNTLLHHAAQAGLPNMVLWLIKQGLRVNALNAAHNSPLSVIIKNMFDKTLSPEKRKKYLAIAEHLLKNKADLTWDGLFGERESALVLAIQTGRTKLVDLIMQFAPTGAVNQPVTGWPPLGWAVYSRNLKMVTHLIDEHHAHVDNTSYETVFKKILLASRTPETRAIDHLIIATLTAAQIDAQPEVGAGVGADAAAAGPGAPRVRR